MSHVTIVGSQDQPDIGIRTSEVGPWRWQCSCGAETTFQFTKRALAVQSAWAHREAMKTR